MLPVGVAGRIMVLQRITLASEYVNIGSNPIQLPLQIKTYTGITK